MALTAPTNTGVGMVRIFSPFKSATVLISFFAVTTLR